MMGELQSTEVVQPGIGGVKPIAWSGIRHMISEVSLSVCLSVDLSVHRSICLCKCWELLGCNLGWTKYLHASSNDYWPTIGAMMSSLDNNACDVITKQ